MPFLKLLMPLATSPIISENRPFPNSSITTMPTISQCQMLKEPIIRLQARPPRRNRYCPKWEVGRLLSTPRSEEHTSELQSLMRNSYAVFCLKKKNKHQSDFRNT